mgnify:CR=1 FL=1
MRRRPLDCFPTSPASKDSRARDYQTRGYRHKWEGSSSHPPTAETVKCRKETFVGGRDLSTVYLLPKGEYFSVRSSP